MDGMERHLASHKSGRFSARAVLPFSVSDLLHHSTLWNRHPSSAPLPLSIKVKVLTILWSTSLALCRAGVRVTGYLRPCSLPMPTYNGTAIQPPSSVRDGDYPQLHVIPPFRIIEWQWLSSFTIYIKGLPCLILSKNFFFFLEDFVL